MRLTLKFVLQVAAFLVCWLGVADGLAAVPRRAFLAVAGAMGATTIHPTAPAAARYVLNEETGDYDEVDDPTWQEAWKDRLDKAQSMSSDEVFMAARGAGNLDLKDGEESAASKKRRAMAACRNAPLLDKIGVKDAKECTGRVFSGEVDFVLKAMDSQ